MTVAPFSVTISQSLGESPYISLQSREWGIRVGTCEANLYKKRVERLETSMQSLQLVNMALRKTKMPVDSGTPEMCVRACMCVHVRACVCERAPVCVQACVRRWYVNRVVVCACCGGAWWWW